MSSLPVGPDQLPAVAAFARVAQRASFTRAAAELGVSPSALSQTVRTLEARLGMRLLNRTTRRVGVTEAGAMFLQRVLPALEQLGAAFSELDELRGKPAGTLRLSLPRLAMRTLLTPLVGEFCRRYPEIRLDLMADDRFVDLVGEGYDAGIRLGESLAQDMIAVRATREQRIAVVGSPEYFRDNPVPQAPADLHEHPCIRFRFSSGVIYRWEFGRDGQEFDIDVDGPLICNDNALMIAAAKQGLGLAHVMEDLVREDLRSGALVRVLEDWCPPFPGLYLYYPSRAQMPLKLRVFIDFLQERLA
ncbi:MAG TPA: LysR family transcriptional regulator [Nevskia sp.]|jgi:DNA-binding transcriptional LysR family regulator|nr:LysR family transcriptional regulator [Nevskia sp.]